MLSLATTVEVVRAATIHSSIFGNATHIERRRRTLANEVARGLWFGLVNRRLVSRILRGARRSDFQQTRRLVICDGLCPAFREHQRAQGRAHVVHAASAKATEFQSVDGHDRRYLYEADT